MIAGVVRSRAAWIPLPIRGPRGRQRNIEAMIDTGFNGTLMLPAGLIKSLGLPWQTTVRGTLADGSQCVFSVFEAVLVWHRQERAVVVVESDTDTLIGMELLDGHELRVQVREGGKVAIRRISSKA